jgi:hypothetical protein
MERVYREWVAKVKWSYFSRNLKENGESENCDFVAGRIGEEWIIVRLASQLRSFVPEFQLKGRSRFRTT